ncbi:MAG TPA: GNAT family N-acetyltransferase [Dehalococcoidia bacterium]|nr:GNAT family N-acetyltransferase [Dehalococcoidia bacterium]
MYQIIQMKKEDIPQVMAIWHRQFTRYCSNDSFPDFWNGGKETIESYLMQQIDKGNAIVAKTDKTLVGYMAWMCISFHNEQTAFCPIVGHAAMEENEESIYHALYTASSQKWVQDNRFNHLWMTFYDDIGLKDMLYDIGFGSYVVDACQKVSQNILQTNCPYRITKAVHDDADALLELENEFNQYLLDSPIFLKREEDSSDDIAQIISQNQVYMAWDNDCLIGVMSINVDQGYHFEKLTTTDSGYIGRIGAFVKSEYRRKGVGTRLLKEVLSYCLEARKSFVHVSFETANPDANRFWPKYFKPVIRSVRRSINKDANDSPTL